MAELPERESRPSLDTLYTLAKKMEAQQPSHPPRSGSGSSDTYRDKYRRYSASVGWVAMLMEEELLPPDPELPDSEMSEPDVIEGLSTVASCVEQLITLQEIALIGRPSVLGMRSI